MKLIVRRGRIYTSNAILHGKFCLRACIVNCRTSDADIAEWSRRSWWLLVNSVTACLTPARDTKLAMPRSGTVAQGPTITAQAPCRADLAGSTMDLWPLYLFHPGARTLNFALSILTSCRVTPLKGKRIELYSIDTRRQESHASLEDLIKARSHEHVLAAQLVRFFAPEHGLRIETNSESPAGAGISGSSAMMIATTAAWPVSPDESFPSKKCA